MIVVGPLFDTGPFTRPSTPRVFRNTLACHMLSDIPGPRGTEELAAFVRQLGLQERWIQERGKPREHFDLTEGSRAAAVIRGAKVVSHRRQAAIVRSKIRATRPHGE